jgi:hypothetical protein
MGHQVQHHKVAPPASIRSINGAQQFLDKGPIKRSWRKFISKTNRLIEEIKRGCDQVAIEAVAQKGSQETYARLQTTARHSARPLLYILFDGMGSEMLQRLAAGQRIAQQGADFGYLIDNRYRHQSANFRQVASVRRQRGRMGTMVLRRCKPINGLEKDAQSVAGVPIRSAMPIGAECPVELLGSPHAAGWKIEAVQHTHGPEDETLRVANEVIVFQQPVRESREVFNVRRGGVSGVNPDE